MDELAESPLGRKRQKAIIPISLDTIWFLVLISTVLLSSCHPTQRPFINIKPGISAPDFNLKAARGGTYNLASLRGETILLSFINTQAKAAASESDPSRAQIVFLKSMQEQYTAKGLNVWIIDAARQETGNQSSLDDLVNFTYNWQLDTIPVLMDEQGDVAKAFGVSSVPTTFLIGMDGVVQQRWDGMASSPQLALAIEALVGPLAYRSTESFARDQPSNCPNESLAQAKFAGVGLARPLSNEIWVIDNGKSWGVGNGFPLQWIVIDSHNKSGTESLHLRVMAHQLNSKNDVVIIDHDLSLLVEDETRGLLLNQSGDVPKTYFLISTLSLDQPGCLGIHAVVTEAGSPLYDGQTIVSAH